jgi:hypothetical protein
VLNPSADRSQPLVLSDGDQHRLTQQRTIMRWRFHSPSGPRLSATDANRIKRKDVPQPFANGIVPEASCCKARALVRSCQRSNLMLSAASGFVSGHLRRMTNLLERAISTDDADRAAKIIQSALGIESDEVANYCFPRTWPRDREQRARIIGDWLRAEVRFLA